MQPGQFAPKGEDWIPRKLADLERQIQQLAAANPFASMGIRPMPDGLIVDGYETVNGPLVVNGDSEFNGPMDVNGNADFNGAMSITGTLSLPAGIINNDALANPLTPLVAHADVANFALTTGANVEKTRTTITVPSGFTQALIYATASMNAKNYNGSTDSMYLACTVNGSAPGWSGQQSVMAGEVGHCTKTVASLLSPAGSSFYVNAKASSGAMNWAASTGDQNTINLDVMVLFLR
jgi:hypothetical protein